MVVAGCWSFCESCGKSFPAKVAKKGHDDCLVEEHSLPYIANSNYYSTVSSFSKRNPIINIENDEGRDFIYLGESIMFLCHFKVGERVLLSFPDAHSPHFQAVRRVWPISDKFGFEVFTSAEGKNSRISSWNQKTVCVEKLCHEPASAAIVTIDIEGLTTLDEHAVDVVKTLTRGKICSATLKDGQALLLDFYNRRIVVHIKVAQGNEISTDKKLKEVLLMQEKNNRLFKLGKQTQTKISFNCESPLPKTSSMGLPPIGLEHIYAEIHNLACAALGLKYTDICFEIPRSLLVFGPSGCGKTLLCETLINNLYVGVVRINSYEISSKFLGETESKLLKLFQIAHDDFAKPTIVLIENIDNICPRGNSNDTQKRICNMFQNLLGNVQLKKCNCKIFILCTTAHIENINPILRRSGKIDTEIEITIPTFETRKKIVQLYLSNFDHSLNDNQIETIASVTHGFVGADLKSLISRAYMHGARHCRNVANISVSFINEALNTVKASAMREVQIENPNVKWEDIGGQDDLKYKLKQIVDWPLAHSETFKKLGIKPPSGILMYGPPGCSKTMIAKALATEARSNFISIKGPELFSMWVGESERAVREVFRKAKEVAPSIIFFDEIDAIGGKRSSRTSSSVSERVLAQMLTELDGITALNNVTVVAATNRPDVIDKALLRPGRLDRLVFVGLPNASARQEIFRIKLKKVRVADDVSLSKLVSETDGYSGAEISAVCQEAVLVALQEDNCNETLYTKHFKKALENTPARTTSELLKIYETYAL